MAKLEIKGRDIAGQFTFTLDVKGLEREIFGVFQWREKVAFFFFKLANAILKTKGEISV